MLPRSRLQSLLFENQNSMALGTYRPNAAIIRLEPLMSFWDEGNEPTPQRLGVFIHEYLHYLHNFTTYSGICDFICVIRLARLFMRTVGENGRSGGSSVLSDADKRQYLELVKWVYRHLRGDSAIYGLTGGLHSGTTLSVERYSRSSATYHLQNSDLAGESVEFDILARTGSHMQSGTLTLGSFCITESVAWEIEKSIYRSLPETTQSEMDADTPPVPYKVARLVLDHVSERHLSDETLVRACLLALQSSDPGAAFVDVACALREGLSRGESEAAIVTRCAERTSETLAGKLTDILKKMVAEELDGFKNRKVLADGIAMLKRVCEQGLELRSRDPFFELPYLATPIDLEALREMIYTHAPCPIIEAQDPPGDEARFYFLAKTLPREADIQGLGTFQGLIEFMKPHLRPDGFAPTDALSPTPCLFYGACGVPLAQKSPEICKRRPWESFHHPESGHRRCWYAAGVGSSMARTTIR